MQAFNPAPEIVQLGHFHYSARRKTQLPKIRGLRLTREPMSFICDWISSVFEGGHDDCWAYPQGVREALTYYASVWVQSNNDLVDLACRCCGVGDLRQLHRPAKHSFIHPHYMNFCTNTTKHTYHDGSTCHRFTVHKVPCSTHSLSAHLLAHSARNLAILWTSTTKYDSSHQAALPLRTYTYLYTHAHILHSSVSGLFSDTTQKNLHFQHFESSQDRHASTPQHLRVHQRRLPCLLSHRGA